MILGVVLIVSYRKQLSQIYSHMPVSVTTQHAQ